MKLLDSSDSKVIENFVENVFYALPIKLRVRDVNKLNLIITQKGKMDTYSISI